jgi:hypothetical protein
MASILVTRDQFNITPQGITHKPADASFVPHCGDPRSGFTRLGRLDACSQLQYSAEWRQPRVLVAANKAVFMAEDSTKVLVVQNWLSGLLAWAWVGRPHPTPMATPTVTGIHVTLELDDAARLESSV